MCRPRLPSNSRGRAEMCSHGLIQRRQMLVSFFFSAHPITRSRGGTLIELGEEDRWVLSLWQWGTRALSRRELASHRLLKSSAPLFFPHRSLEGRRREGTRGGVAFWEESYSWVQRCKTETLTVRAISPAERSIRSNPATWGISTADPSVSKESAK